MCSDDENSRVITYVHIAANTKVFEPCFRLIVCLMAIFSNKKKIIIITELVFTNLICSNVVETIGLKQVYFFITYPLSSNYLFRNFNDKYC